MTDTTEMTQAELADFYERTGDLSEFEGGDVVKVEPGPKDSIVSVRFAAGELAAVVRQADEADMKLTAYIRASALSGAHVVDLDRLREVAAKLVADSEEMSKVINLRTNRPVSRSTVRPAKKSPSKGKA
jgi:molybdopterin-binding protein